MNYFKSCELTISALSAVGTLIVIILAIWGEFIKAKVAGPKLFVELKDPGSEIMSHDDKGKPEFCYHLRVKNDRSWVLAKNVRVRVKKIYKLDTEGEIVKNFWNFPFLLTWQYSIYQPDYHPIAQNIGHEQICDLGFIKEGNFRLATYEYPKNFAGLIGPNQHMRVEIIAIADNGQSKPLWIDIKWDGKWDNDGKKMSEQLLIKKL